MMLWEPHGPAASQAKTLSPVSQNLYTDFCLASFCFYFSSFYIVAKILYRVSFISRDRKRNEPGERNEGSLWGGAELDPLTSKGSRQTKTVKQGKHADP